MSDRKSTVVRAQAGVKLERIEDLAKKQKDISFRLTTHRQQSARLIHDEAEAGRAFAREVAASLEDPIVQGLLKSGYLEN
ncbi:hypothetical protein ACFPIF_11710 [Brevundimonas faecalis]|uniref:hypothetical protein n=1 Tax=Brevundimonas faecalis TaxID=947378 RepID=UPI00361DB0F1